jgi:RNA polymerase sigma-70 factor (ECF subfamily)
MTEGAVRVALSRMRSRFGDYLRAVIADTVENPAETDEELRYLISVLNQ